MIARINADGTPVMDFAATEELARTKSSACLAAAIADCHKAMDANPDNLKNSYYADEIHVYAAELEARRCNIHRSGDRVLIGRGYPDWTVVRLGKLTADLQRTDWRGDRLNRRNVLNTRLNFAP